MTEFNLTHVLYTMEDTSLLHVLKPNVIFVQTTLIYACKRPLKYHYTVEGLKTLNRVVTFQQNREFNPQVKFTVESSLSLNLMHFLLSSIKQNYIFSFYYYQINYVRDTVWVKVAHSQSCQVYFESLLANASHYTSSYITLSILGFQNTAVV